MGTHPGACLQVILRALLGKADKRLAPGGTRSPVIHSGAPLPPAWRFLGVGAFGAPLVTAHPPSFGWDIDAL